MNILRWRALRIFVAVVLCIVGVTSAALAQSAADRELTIAFVVKNVINPFWKLARLGADEAAREAGNVRVVHLAPTKPDDLNESIQIMEDLITRYQAGAVDAVVFVPVDYKAMVPVVQKANEVGLPIINYSNRLAAGGDYVTFIGYDDKEIAMDIVHFLAARMLGKGNVIILEGVPGAITAQDRLEGWREALQDYPDIKVLASQTANFSRAQALQVMENLLVQFPQVDAVIAANDETALGAIRALMAAGKAGKVLVTGIDATLDGLNAVLQGNLTVTADYSGYEQGYHAMKAAIAYLRGEEVPKEMQLEHSLVHLDNVHQFFEKLRAQLGRIE